MWLAALALAGARSGAATAAPALQGLDAPRRVACFKLFEARVEVLPRPANPFDPDEVDLQAVFVDPGGAEHRAIGFWYQAYERALVGGVEQLAPMGEPHFRVRFTPDAVGDWTWWWEVRTPDGTAQSAVRTLRVVPSNRHGFLRRSRRDERYLAFDDGTPYFAVGENLGWYDGRGTYAYDAWLAALAHQGANYARLWMPSWAMGVEWSDTGLGDYTARLDRAWQLDHVLRRAERRGIHVMLSLQNHGAFSARVNPEWAGNPYNAANGGPLAAPGAIFTDPEAKAWFKRRLRYVVARWGFSTAILAWELWNEADLVDGYRSGPSRDWHREMADWLRALDPHGHLVSTSFSTGLLDTLVWLGSGLDFTQLHFYSTFEFNGVPVTAAPNLAEDVVGFSAARLALAPLPVLFAEIGVDARGPAETRAADPGGIGVHDGLWAGVVSQGFGTAMGWWWDNLIDLEPDLYYPMFGAVARFVDGVAFDREAFEALAGSAAEPGGRPLVAYGLQGERAFLVWLKDDAFQWYAPDPAEIAGAVLRLDALPAGGWCGSWYDTWAGRWRRGVRRIAADGGPLELVVPRFERDLALRLRRCPRVMPEGGAP